MRFAAEELIGIWSKRLGIEALGFPMQRMKTRWGSCNTVRRHIRLNTELVKKPKDLLEYVVLHELLHLKEPNHREAFLAMLDSYLPTWRGARAELNELPLGT